MMRAFVKSQFLGLALVVLGMMVWVLPVRAGNTEHQMPVVDLVPQMLFSHGTAADPDDMYTAYGAGRFAADVAPRPFEGDHAAELWGAVELSAFGPQMRRVLIDIAMLSEVDVYLYQGKNRTDLLSYSMFRPFDRTQHAGRRLQTAPFALPKPEPQVLLLHFKFGPVHQLNVTLEDSPTTQTETLRDVASWAGFYAFALAAICVFLAYFAALRDGMSLLYALLFLTGLSFLSYMDGLLFRFAYPNVPQIQSAVGFALFLGMASFGYGLAGLGFHHAGVRRAAHVAWGLAAISVALFLSSLFAPGPVAAFAGYVLVIGMCIAVALGTRLPPGPNTASRRVARVLSLMVIGGLLAVLMPLIMPAIPAPLGILASAKLLYVVLILAGLANLTAQILAVRQAQAAAQQAELAALSREADLARQLAGSEQNYARAQALATQRQQTLATAAHDIRQPLKSLRLRLDSLAGSLTQDAAARLREALDYIDRLTTDYMETPDHTALAEETADYDVAIVIASVHRMFAQEALEKGLDLRTVPTGARTGLTAAPLMRIVCNLVVNAIRHTDQGGIVIGVRRRAGKPWLCVADTGPGFAIEDFEHLKTAGAKGDTSDGHGFGLAVCAQLAAELGVAFDAQSIPGRGTCFFLGLHPV